MKTLKVLKTTKRVSILTIDERNVLKGGGVVKGADNLTGELD